MRRMVHAFVLMSALTALGCGATTRDTTAPATSAPSAGTTAAAPQSGPQELSGEPGVLVTGQEFDVRLQTMLSSETAQVEQRFEATTVSDLTQRGEVLVPAGSMVRGMVTAVEPAGRLDRTGSLTLSFDSIRIRGREYPMRAMAAQVYESGGLREDAPTAGAGGVVGGVIGGVVGGVRGAIIGAVIGAGGAIAATEGKDVTLPAGSLIRLRVDSTVNVASPK